MQKDDDRRLIKHYQYLCHESYIKDNSTVFLAYACYFVEEISLYLQKYIGRSCLNGRYNIVEIFVDTQFECVVHVKKINTSTGNYYWDSFLNTRFD